MEGENESSDQRGFSPKWSIGTKLTIAFLALAIIPMSITAYYNLNRGQNALQGVAEENLVELSRGTASRIEQLLADDQQTSTALVGEPVVVLTTSKETIF